MQSITSDIDSIGGGMGGMGMGGFGNNPLLWLITLGFLRGDGGLFGGNNNNNAQSAGAGVLAGETQAKLDCLAQQHQTLSNQITNGDNVARFQAVSNQITNLEGVSRDGVAAVTNQINDLRAQAAECCCDTKVAIQEVNTNIAQQTATLAAEGLANTQRILDRLCAGDLALKDAEIRRLQDSLQTQTIIANCHGGHGGNGGNNIDINVLARALQGQAQA
tara:strand:+ start:1439 stop:2095 length:657 start_codon:yes stop_codon:yes gene_type:complete